MLERFGFAALMLIGAAFFSLWILFRPFWIPAGSMKPALLVGDYLAVSRFAYGITGAQCPAKLCPLDWHLYRTPAERGDVVVFRHPVNGTSFIKRVVGLPGDRVQMQNGLLLINETPMQLKLAEDFVETYAPQGPAGYAPKCANAPVSAGEPCLKERQVETLPNGVQYSILNLKDGFIADDTQVFTVPERHYFVLGDHRDNSMDSRFPQQTGGVGFVPQENLIGKARWVLFSSAGASLWDISSWRSDRYFKEVE